MSKEMFVELQTPTVEIEIEAIDGGGHSSKFIAGFKRTGKESSDKLLEDFSKLSSELVDKLTKISQASYVADDDASELNITSLKKEVSEIETFMENMVNSSIIYIKTAKLRLIETDKGVSKEVVKVVKDSRTETEKDKELWGDSCLKTLLGMYQKSPPWRAALTKGFQASLVNIDLESLNLKN